MDQISQKVQLSESFAAHSCCLFRPLSTLSNFIFHPGCFPRRLKSCSRNLPGDSVLEQIPISCLFPLMRPGLRVTLRRIGTAGTQVIRKHLWYHAENRPKVRSGFIIGCSCYGFPIRREEILCFLLQRKVIFVLLPIKPTQK